MPLFRRPRLSALWKSLTHLPEGKKKHSLAYLNIAQFCGSLNDNIFKLVMAFFLIDLLGQEKASSILSAAGATYVIPFLLFSSSAGIIADRFSKQKLLVAMKVVEIVTMLLAIFIFGFKIAWGSYALLFILAGHSAMFSPAKYGIIPEIVEKEKISRANGLITSFTYLAIISGTFLASFLTEVTHRNYVLTASFCLLVAVAGFFSAARIEETAALGGKKKINPLFIREIIHTLIYCKNFVHLLPCLFGAAFFLFLGAFTQLNIIPFAIQSLHLSAVSGGYLFLATALGIALGAYLAGRVLKKKIELGLPCMAMMGICILLLLLAVCSHHVLLCVIILFLMGVCGGLLIVPLDSFVQSVSPNERRGQIIAAGNFLSFTGVLLASFSLYAFSNYLHISSAAGFAMIGFGSGLISLIFTALLSDYSLPYLSRKFLYPFCRVRVQHAELLEEPSKTLFVLQNATVKKCLLLFGTAKNLQLLIPEGRRSLLSLARLFYSVHFLEQEEKFDAFLRLTKKQPQNATTFCLVLDKELSSEEESVDAMVDIRKYRWEKVIYVRIEKSPHGTMISFTF